MLKVSSTPCPGGDGAGKDVGVRRVGEAGGICSSGRIGGDAGVGEGGGHARDDPASTDCFSGEGPPSRMAAMRHSARTRGDQAGRNSPTSARRRTISAHQVRIEDASVQENNRWIGGPIHRGGRTAPSDSWSRAAPCGWGGPGRRGPSGPGLRALPAPRQPACALARWKLSGSAAWEHEQSTSQPPGETSDRGKAGEAFIGPQAVGQGALVGGEGRRVADDDIEAGTLARPVLCRASKASARRVVKRSGDTGQLGALFAASAQRLGGAVDREGVLVAPAASAARAKPPTWVKTSSIRAPACEPWASPAAKAWLGRWSKNRPVFCPPVTSAR